MAVLKGEELAIACAGAIEEIQGENIVILDVGGISTLTDFLVICSGKSLPHLKAVARDVRQKVFELAEAKPLHQEGRAASRWMVLDYIDVMVHIMDEESREHYRLEELWGDAKPVEFTPYYGEAAQGTVEEQSE